MLIERRPPRIAGLLGGLAFLLMALPALAQQEMPQAAPQPLPPADGQALAAAPPTDRLGRVEQQIADLQAMVAALESLVKTRPDVTLPQEGAPGENVGNAAGLTARMDAVETQIGALSSQLELMTQQLGAIEARLGGAGAPQQLAPPQDEAPMPQPQAEQPMMAPPPSSGDPLPELPRQ
jgi:hypothetical protein